MSSKVSFASVHRKPLVDEVVQQLQKKISSGDIAPGDKIPTEPELMEQFHVGRSTIREAVRVLVHAGLLEKKQGFGTFLRPGATIQEPLDNRLRRAEIMEVYEVRQMMELEIARLAAERRDDDDLRRIKEHLDTRNQALKDKNLQVYIDADIRFHIAVSLASKNAVVTDLYKSFSVFVQETLTKIFANPDGHNPQTEAHIKLYESIRDRDAAGAVAWTSRYLKGTIDELFHESS
ncbi:FadR/GntR family transcriptional regulator [Paenibacillus sp. MBLB4367]|uniref:FadR/GntR family transcriptional regulator n=1 Tax=Paenibacillus sp. MBLB4367 TaxID=3384767 RepID=UPI003907E78B